MSLNLPDLKVEEENVVVGRILLAIHKSLDQDFPHSVSKDARFIKTVFSEDEEKTVADRYQGSAPADLPVDPSAVSVAKDTAPAPLLGSSIAPSDIDPTPKTNKDWLAVTAVVFFAVAAVFVGYIILFL